jgi:hypothetical protein
MKTISFIIFLSVVIFSTVSGQSNSEKPPFSVGTVTPPIHQTGKPNYLLSFSEQDFNNGKYIMYTDSNATVAYININGNILRLTGGPNPEHIMAYTCKGFTVTLSNPANASLNNLDENGNLKVVASITIYNKMGQAVVEKVTDAQKSGDK